MEAKIKYEVANIDGDLYMETESLDRAIERAKWVLAFDKTRTFVFIRWVENGADFHELECTIDQWGRFRMDYNR